MQTKDRVYDYHVVLQGETLYSLAKKYNTTVAELLVLNPEIVDNNLPLGGKIKVPVTSEATSHEISKKTENAILYTVQKKETLYSISKRNNTNVETLMLWNDLEEPSIQEGAQLIVGYESSNLPIIGPLPVATSGESLPTDGPEQSTDSPFKENTSSTPEAKIFPDELAEKGIATWVKSSDDDQDFYALHPTAPKGTEVMVKNMMNGKAVTVKVIGKLPSTSANENVLIKISGSAAKRLGVLDEKFLAGVYYEGMKNATEESTQRDLK
ncbi:MAG: LysM peptidoglycan-binding domain-containing protein [Chitinophagales bacterium]